MEEDEEDRACDTHDNDEKWLQNFIRKPRREKTMEGDVDADEGVMLGWMLRRYGVIVWTEFIWLRIVSLGGLLWTR
jgi:hypothetical protein